MEVGDSDVITGAGSTVKGDVLEPTPVGSTTLTVTPPSVPSREPGMVAVSCVPGPFTVVLRICALPTDGCHFNVAVGAKFWPFTVRRRDWPPIAAVVGKTL